jgi:hypothetical protein
MNWGDIPTWVATVVAAVFGALSWRSSRAAKAAESAAEEFKRQALTAAQDAAAAEGRAADAAVRSAGALEAQSQLAAEQAAAAEGVPWRVEYSHGAKWVLLNVSDTPKFNVKITGPGVWARRTPDVVDRIDGQSSYEIWGSSEPGEKRIDVTWHQREGGQGEPGTWSSLMPPRPPLSSR